MTKVPNIAYTEDISRMIEYKRLKDAHTIKELRDRLNEAIAIAGEDATWNGFDDEAIYIYPKKGRHISIFPCRVDDSINKHG